MFASKIINTMILVVIVMVYHFHTSHAGYDETDASGHKSHVLKAKDVSCEGGACDEKNDHVHEHKKKRKKTANVNSFNLAVHAS